MSTQFNCKLPEAVIEEINALRAKIIPERSSLVVAQPLSQAKLVQTAVVILRKAYEKYGDNIFLPGFWDS